MLGAASQGETICEAGGDAARRRRTPAGGIPGEGSERARRSGGGYGSRWSFEAPPTFGAPQGLRVQPVEGGRQPLDLPERRNRRRGPDTATHRDRQRHGADDPQRARHTATVNLPRRSHRQMPLQGAITLLTSSSIKVSVVPPRIVAESCGSGRSIPRPIPAGCRAFSTYHSRGTDPSNPSPAFGTDTPRPCLRTSIGSVLLTFGCSSAASKRGFPCLRLLPLFNPDSLFTRYTAMPPYPEAVRGRTLLLRTAQVSTSVYQQVSLRSVEGSWAPIAKPSPGSSGTS